MALIKELDSKNVVYTCIKYGQLQKLTGMDIQNKIDAILAAESGFKPLLLVNGSNQYLGAIIPSDKIIDTGKLKRIPQIKRLFDDYGFVTADPKSVGDILCDDGYRPNRISPFAFDNKGIPALIDVALEGSMCVLWAGEDLSLGYRFSMGEFARLGYLYCDICKIPNPFEEGLDYRC